jgi:hypothetical protein
LIKNIYISIKLKCIYLEEGQFLGLPRASGISEPALPGTSDVNSTSLSNTYERDLLNILHVGICDYFGHAWRVRNSYSFFQEEFLASIVLRANSLHAIVIFNNLGLVIANLVIPCMPLSYNFYPAHALGSQRLKALTPNKSERCEGWERVHKRE